MAAILWADVTGMFPSDAVLAGIPVAAQNNILQHVNTELSAAFFGGEEAPKMKLARIYLAAHMACAGGSGATGPIGPVIVERLGPLDREYAPFGLSSVVPGAHGETTYGRLFDGLVLASPMRVGVVS